MALGTDPGIFHADLDSTHNPLLPLQIKEEVLPTKCTNCDRCVEQHILVFEVILDLQREGQLPKGSCSAIMQRLCAEGGCNRENPEGT